MPTCALIGSSDFNEQMFVLMYDAGLFDCIIAVDGGYQHLLDLGYRVDMAVGDFDSLGFVPCGIRKAVYPSDKDKSDMELAIDHALRLGNSDFVVFGALGRRLDHTISNLQIFAKQSEAGSSVKMIGTDEIVYFVSGPNVLELPAKKGGVVSVFSLSNTSSGVFIRGLKWEVDNACVSNRTSFGLSNEFIGKAAAIGVDSGTIIVIAQLAEHKSDSVYS